MSAGDVTVTAWILSWFSTLPRPRLALAGCRQAILEVGAGSVRFDECVSGAACRTGMCVLGRASRDYLATLTSNPGIAVVQLRQLGTVMSGLTFSTVELRTRRVAA